MTLGSIVGAFVVKRLSLYEGKVIFIHLLHNMKLALGDTCVKQASI